MNLRALAAEIEADGLALLERARRLRELADKEEATRQAESPGRRRAAPAAAPDTSRPRLIALSEWPEHHPWPSVPALRNYVFFEKENGASAWVRRLGRRVLVDEAAFFEWVKARGVTKAESS